MYKIVEKQNRNAVHGLFDDYGRALRHLVVVVPDYVARSYFMDKSLRSDSFEIVKDNK